MQSYVIITIVNTHMYINIQCHIIMVGHMVKWVAKMTNVMTMSTKVAMLIPVEI